MNNRLQKEIMNSMTIKNYIKLQRLTKFFPTIKWILGISFIVGFFDATFNQSMNPLIMGALIAIWAPTITFSFLGAILHFSAEQEIHGIAIRYGLSSSEVLCIARELLASK